MTTGKPIALIRRTFVDKVMSLLFNMLSRLVITFLPRSKHLLILWLQSPSAVILEPPKIKPATVQSSNAITLGWISLQVLMCIRKVAWNERQVSTICGTPPHSSTKWTVSSHTQWHWIWKCWSHLKDEEAEDKNGQLLCQRPSRLGTVKAGIWT